MATVYMLTTTDNTMDLYQRLDFDRLMAAARDDIFQTHTLVEAPEQADIILFVGSKYLDHRDVRAHPFLRHYRSKCFHFHKGRYLYHPFLTRRVRQHPQTLVCLPPHRHGVLSQGVRPGY